MLLERPSKYRHIERTFLRGNLLLHLIALGLFVLNLSAAVMTYSVTKEFISPTVLFTFFTAVILVAVQRVKSSRIDPNYFMPENTMSAARQEALDAREQKRIDLFAGDISILKEGNRSEVLSIWKLDATLTSRHFLFKFLHSVTIDPSERSCLVLLRFPKSPIPDETDIKPYVLTLFRHLRDFLKIVAGDKYLKEVAIHFDTLFLVFDFLSYDDKGFEHRNPFLSFKISGSSLNSISALPSAGSIDLVCAGEMRFDGGKSIEPHHSLDDLQRRGK